MYAFDKEPAIIRYALALLSMSAGAKKKPIRQIFRNIVKRGSLSLLRKSTLPRRPFIFRPARMRPLAADQGVRHLVVPCGGFCRSVAPRR